METIEREEKKNILHLSCDFSRNMKLVSRDLEEEEEEEEEDQEDQDMKDHERKFYIFPIYIFFLFPVSLLSP